jgi:hypothetical protein
MKIIFCIPGKNFSNNFLVSWTKLVKYCDSNNIEYELSNVDISIVHLARYGCLMIDPESQCGVCLNPFQKEVDYDYIMWIDSDMVFEPAHFEKLLKAEKRVITGLAKINRTNEYACFKKDKNERITDEYIKNNSGIIETSFTGMSFMLIKYGVYEEMQFPYFSVPGESGMLSETLSFCHNLSKANIPIHAHLDVIIGHEKPMII